MELDSHEVISAEGLPAESYLEMGNKSFLAGADFVTPHVSPDEQVATNTRFCRQTRVEWSRACVFFSVLLEAPAPRHLPRRRRFASR